MACGTPVIGSNIGGITDIIENGYNGFLSEPKNPDDIADKVIILLSDEKLRQSFSKEGLKTVKNRFSWNAVVEEFCEALKNTWEVYHHVSASEKQIS